MSVYKTVVDLTNKNSSQTLEALMVGEGRRVLDVGCASGYLARALVSQGCTVSGIEIDAEAAEEARPYLDELVIADLEATPLGEAFAGKTFDRIVFGDVLEHITDPSAVLRAAVELLDTDGEIVISVPNVAHGAVRLALLGGRWTYTETGLLDRTHLRFFTLESLVELVEGAGLVIREAWATSLDVLGTEVKVPDGLPEEVVEWVRHQPRALDYQFVVRVSRGEPTGNLPPVHPAIAADDVRPDDVWAKRARENADLVHGALVQRDHVIGLEARATRAERAEQTALARVARLTKQQQEIRRSLTWRIGRAVTAPVIAMKKAVR